MAPESATPGRAAPFTRWSERLNPVLVKEVRAALRGRAFAIGFVIVLGLTLIASVIALLTATGDQRQEVRGLAYVAGMGWVFSIGLNILVPFSAMASMAAEHDEAALEQLQLSGLTPGRVVRGKLGAAVVQAALLYCAATPFLVFAVLLPGVDPWMIALGILSSFSVAIAFSSLGILLGATFRKRWMRALAYVGLALTLLFGSQVLLVVSTMSMRLGGSVAGVPGIAGSAVLAIACAFACAWACTLASSRIAHAEEDRSRGFRILTTAALLVLCGFGLASVSGADLLGGFLWAVLLQIPVLLIGLSEPERMPRAALAGRRRTGIVSLLATPWTAGGGRAVLCAAVHAALVLGASGVTAARLGTQDARAMFGVVACVQLYVLVATLLPSGVLARWMGRPWAQLVARLSSVLGAVAALLVPTFVGFLAGAGQEALRHAGNPAHLPMDLFEDSDLDDTSGLALLLALLLVAIALNAPRAVRGVLEVRRARARRVALEGLRAATQP